MNIQEFDEQLTALVVKAIEEKNIAPWRKPWTGGLVGPTNYLTRQQYQGANFMSLAIHEMCLEYRTSYWVGFNQCNSLGGRIKAGEHGVAIAIPAKVKVGKNEQEEDIFALRFKHSTVFNLDQTTLDLPAIEERVPVDTLPALAAIIDGYPNRPEIYEKEQGRAYYDMQADAITLPAAHQWSSPEDRAYTTLHELTHSTGHESRVGRFKDEKIKPARFGSGTYAFEELVADIGAQILMDRAGIPVDLENSIAYLRGWLQPLRDDVTLLRKASQEAFKAANYIAAVHAPDPQPVAA